jgi:hypothetical protein
MSFPAQSDMMCVCRFRVRCAHILPPMGVPHTGRCRGVAAHRQCPRLHARATAPLSNCGKCCHAATHTMPPLSVPQSKGHAPRASSNPASGAASGPKITIKKKVKTPNTLQAGKKKGGMWWQEEEVNVMLEVVKKIRPRGSTSGTKLKTSIIAPGLCAVLRATKNPSGPSLSRTQTKIVTT